MTDQQNFDAIVIGAGPGGYVCAIRLAQLGFNVACVEKNGTLGGTCLNVGCIPSKALLSDSEKFHALCHEYADIGVRAKDIMLDLRTMMAHKDSVIESNTKGIEFLFKKNKVTWIKGHASFKDAHTIIVDETEYTANHIIIATGSEVAGLPGIEIDEERVVSSTGALSLKQIPKTMIVIGGGYIGLEMGTVWQRLGADVCVIEYLDRILPGMDHDISAEMQKILTKQGMKFKLGTKVNAAMLEENTVKLKIEPAQGGEQQILQADIVLVAVGRKPHTHRLGLEKIGAEMTQRGQIATNAHFATSVEGVYAIGDVREGPMLAHKAEEEGVVLAEILAGQSGHIDYNLVPGVVYTDPEGAQIGKTEQQLKDSGVSYKVGKFPFMANGRARAMNKIQGFVKILSDANTDRILGAHIIGPEAGTLIHEIAVAMEFGGTSEDIARTCHAHPTLNEVVKEAALDVENRAVHM